jgi:Sulfotransferase domain
VRPPPDFVVIGAMKCGTTTLHAQLGVQPGIFMSRPKEPNFFSDDAQYARGLEWYRSLFAAAPPQHLRGESSTHYTKLPAFPHTVDRISRHAGAHVRFIYLMRHPIDRLTSHYIHEWTNRGLTGPIDATLDTHPELIEYGRYAMQIRPYLRTFGPERVLPVFFDRLFAHPQAELDRITAFLGYRGLPRWDDRLREQNVSGQRMRKSAWRSAIVNLPGTMRLRRRLLPRSLGDRIKGLWLMKERPRLSSASVERLRQIYDQDLAVLGDWLGLPLTCDAFKALTATTVPAWQLTVPRGP